MSRSGESAIPWDRGQGRPRRRPERRDRATTRRTRGPAARTSAGPSTTTSQLRSDTEQTSTRSPTSRLVWVTIRTIAKTPSSSHWKSRSSRAAGHIGGNSDVQHLPGDRVHGVGHPPRPHGVVEHPDRQDTAADLIGVGRPSQEVVGVARPRQPAEGAGGRGHRDVLELVEGQLGTPTGGEVVAHVADLPDVAAVVDACRCSRRSPGPRSAPGPGTRAGWCRTRATPMRRPAR